MLLSRSILVAAVTLVVCCGCSDEVETQVRKLEDIRKLPVGLRVTHSPNPVAAAHGGRSGHSFTWTYETSVEAIDVELKIEEFGVFFENGAKWTFSNYTGKPFSGQDFADWYTCPDARLRPGVPARDPQNWSGSHQLRAKRTVWYFIGVAADGRRFRGEAVIEERAEIGESR